MKSAFLDKLIERLDRLDPGSLQTHFLRLSQERGLLETILQALQEGLVFIDGKGRIRYFNKAAANMLGLSQGEAEGKKISRYIHAIEWDRILNFDGGEWSRFVNREIEVSYPEHRFLVVYLVPVAATEVDEQGAVLLMRDVTRDRKREFMTIETERFQAITLLAASVAHEIGNPLNSLAIHLQLIERELREIHASGSDDLVGLVNVAQREVTRLDQIVQQFLDAVRPVPPQLESASVEEILDDTLAYLRHEMADRRIEVTKNREAVLPLIKADRGQLRQVFFNIMKNAMEAMDDGGRLEVKLGSDDFFVNASFEDSGAGIASDDMGRLFEPYQSNKPKGSGLGLMIVQRIIRDHGGEIEVQSEPGRGTRFVVHLPRKQRRMRLLGAPDSKENDK